MTTYAVRFVDLDHEELVTAPSMWHAAYAFYGVTPSADTTPIPDLDTEAIYCLAASDRNPLASLAIRRVN